ncbi:cytochrome b561/ferric reductase transmembrane with DOMON related domain-containing protein [Tasmannia lanceolata]|uniref:cytochrome b561/ferric reductase transmembrane with DOMON related domain-containing protein n=1 Tax=Tasmannia lanceolata TaxID=3420 RepID=UPI0040641511
MMIMIQNLKIQESVTFQPLLNRNIIIIIIIPNLNTSSSHPPYPLLNPTTMAIQERFSYIPFFSLLLILSIAMISEAQTDNCNSDISSFFPSLFNKSSTLICKSVWNNFILRYSQSQDNMLSVVLSAAYTTGWVGIGFSKDGMMVGSSAMVGWINRVGKARIKQYYLRGQTPSEVIVNGGELQTTNISPVVVLYGATLYLAFQLKFPAPLTQQPLIFAFGTATPSHSHLTKHEDETTVQFDFSAGTSSASSSYPYQLKRNHGALAIFGWGVLLPIGAIIARYCRHWDPLWYYLHSVIQFVGFLIGLASVVAGISLYDKLHSNVRVHRGLGIFVFVLFILQVIAFFLRPQKDSKVRRYWNWYHHWVGRLALFLAAVNIVLGIQVGGAGNGWKAGYGFNLAVILITVFVLESILCIRRSKKPIDQKPIDPPSFQMQPPH